MEFGILPTESKFQKLSAFELDFLYSVIEKRREESREHIERILGVRWDRQAVAMMGSGKGKGRPPESMITPLSMLLGDDVYKKLKTLFGFDPNSHGYSEDADLDSMIGGKIVKKSKNVEVVHIDDRFSAEEARAFFRNVDAGGAKKTRFDPSAIRNEPGFSELPFTEKGMEQLVDMLNNRRK